VTQTHPEVNRVIQLASGIANLGHDHVSTAALHFAPLRLFLNRQLHTPVNEPVVPCDLGLLGPTHEIAKKFNVAMERELDRYPNAEVYFIAHSLGGLLTRNFLLQSPEARERTIGLITLGTPHDGVHGSHLRRFASITSNINGLAADVAGGFFETGELPNLSMTATTLDLLVAPGSALPESIEADKHLYAHLGSSALLGRKIHRHRNPVIDHNGLVGHLQAIKDITHLAGQAMRHSSSAPADYAFERSA
jgi:pimeloyl-ACP methyl ester carboxylesterase